jgi:hypothetical protein
MMEVMEMMEVIEMVEVLEVVEMPEMPEMPMMREMMELLVVTMMLVEVFALVVLIGLGRSSRPQADGRRDKQAREFSHIHWGPHNVVPLQPPSPRSAALIA